MASDITTIQIDKETLQKLKDLEINLDWIKLTTLNQKVVFLLNHYNKTK